MTNNFPFVAHSQETVLAKEVVSVFCLKIYPCSTGGRIFIADVDGLFQSFDGLNTCLFQSEPSVCSQLFPTCWERVIFSSQLEKGVFSHRSTSGRQKIFLLITKLRNHYQYNVTFQPLNSIEFLQRSWQCLQPICIIKAQDPWPEKRNFYQEIGNR